MIQRPYIKSRCLLLATLLVTSGIELRAQEARYVTERGYERCIELKNPTTRVVLCPAAGGRVLIYEYQGTNSLYVDEADRGDLRGDQRQNMSAGRFDIGPEKTIPRHPVLWSGPWRGEIVDGRAARLTSQPDEATGVRLVRDFQLDPTSSRLRCTQTIHNVSKQVREWCHWSRTFAVGNGICVIPLSSPSRFPHKYVMYETGDLINIKPTDAQIREQNGFLEILDVPRHPKLGMDSQVGWFAYLAPNDLMFVKQFSVDPDRVYNEAAGLTISIWYPEDRRVELEPIGPRERLQPGESASFTEVWWLIPHEFPDPRSSVDSAAVADIVKRQTQSR